MGGMGATVQREVWRRRQHHLPHRTPSTKTDAAQPAMILRHPPPLPVQR